MVKHKKSESGQSLFEALLALAVFSMAIAAIAHLFLAAHYSVLHSVEKFQAVLLAREGIEAVRSIKNNDFEALAPGSYDLALEDGKWILVELNVNEYPRRINNKYARTIEISNHLGDETRKAIEVHVDW